MKIKSIKMHNFMRYKGDNELFFSTDKKKNVTVVLGDNTFGKTTLAQAFRWGLYETLNDTSYTKKRDIVLLNNEVAAEMKSPQVREVSVEIVVENEDEEIRFIRKASFNKKSGLPNDISVKQIGETQLTMQFKSDGIWGDIISNSGVTLGSVKYTNGCVQETIDNLFPPNLSNYFFFDGERWNDLKSKTEDIKNSVNTILGVSGLVEMMNHLKNRAGNNVERKLRSRIKGFSGEYERLQREIESYDNDISMYEMELRNFAGALETVNRTIDSTDKVLRDNKKVEEDQNELQKLENDIERNERFKNDYYADIVKEISNSAKFYASSLLPELDEVIKKVDLEGKDIPGVTVDTIDYLLESGECLCGTKLTDDSEAYKTLVKLKKQVPPEMLGGAAVKLKTTLEAWKNETSEMVENINAKADGFDNAQSTIDDKTTEKERLEKTIDRKTNLGPVRNQNKEAKERAESIKKNQATYEYRLENAKENRQKKIDELDRVAGNDKDNAVVYRCLAYLDKMYEKAEAISKQRKQTILTDLNEIIGQNFKKMFNDREKYAQLGSDYRIHVYYHQVGELTNYEEENLSNGETIAINFVFIVSILELANQYRDLEKENEDDGMEDAILGLPLVLDGPFSALSNENTTLVANRLPQFAEQVIVFMLDKDWEASGLEHYTLPEYCYRVNKEPSSNSASLELN